MELSRRKLLIGGAASLIVAPSIVRPESLMRIFSIDDWDPWVIAYNRDQRGFICSVWNDGCPTGTFRDAKVWHRMSAFQRQNILTSSKCWDHYAYTVVRKSATS